MQRRSAAVSVALALLLVSPAALAGKPTRTLPHPSASRRVGPESLAHVGRRESQRAEARSIKRRKSRDVSKAAEARGVVAKGHGGVSSRRQRRDSADMEAKSPRTREVATRQRRRLAKSRVSDRKAQKSGRTSFAADQSVRTKIRSTDSRFSAGPLRVPSQLNQADDRRDPDPSDVAAQQAFGSLSPLKSIEQEAGTPVLLPNLRVASLYDSRGRLIVPAPLYGSKQILLHQNEMADRDGLDRIRDNAGLEDLLRQRKLVALPAGEMLEVDDRLPSNRRYSRPWTAAFLSVLSRDFYANFHQPIEITSAVRTVEVQQRLVRTNGNAAAVTGDSASPHLTGQAVDIAKHGLSMTQVAWLRTYLQPLIGDGKIDVEEEFRQACFHISVYRAYLPMAPRVAVTAARESTADTRP